MPELLLELFSEEIPARMQRKAADDLRRLVTGALVEAGLPYEGAKAFATPRRLALTVTGIPAHSPATREERKGPKVGAPEQAIQGFLRSAGLASIDEAAVRSDPKKGDFYVAVIEKAGRATADILAEAIPAIIRAFPWPKSMHWGSGRLTWVRPLQSILCTFGPETEEPEIVRFEVDGIQSSNVTRGHRFMAPEPFAVRRFEDYAERLEKAKVVLDADRRKDIILHDARDRALALGLDLVEDDGLLEEVAGLVEWPAVLSGSFEEDFLAIPPEVIRATIRANQKCFVLRKPGSTALANRFILVANIEARDGGAAITAGNGRVIRARLSDAKFFYETDLKATLESRLPKFEAIVFHDKLGTQAERIARIERLAGEIAGALAGQPDFFDGRFLDAGDLSAEQEYRRQAERAARLAKLDLVTEMVGEFPELQGLMGRYYAAAAGEPAAVAAAIEEHYKPQGPSDRVPADPVAIAVALADKLDTLVGFWAIDEKPTGSKDPYALRRAALGVIRIVLENGLRVRLSKLIARAHFLIWSDIDDPKNAPRVEQYKAWLNETAVGVIGFFYDRLKVQLRDSGARHDLVDAVLAAGAGEPSPPLWGRGGEGGAAAATSAEEGPHPNPPPQGGRESSGSSGKAPPPGPSPAVAGEGEGRETSPAGAAEGAGERSAPAPAANDDLLDIVRRVEALGAFLSSEDGANLLAGYRRAANILKAEEKGGERFDGAVDTALLVAPEEQALAEAVVAAEAAAAAAVAHEDYAGAMAALARLRGPVDAFFEAVLVNAEDAAIRANRLNLLAAIRRATRAVADFSKVGG